MNDILLFLQEHMDAVITIFGIIIAVLLVLNGVQLAQQKNRIKDAMNRKSMRGSVNPRTMETSMREEVEKVTPETIHRYEKDFNQVCSVYNVLAQFIPLFPLFGLLGTVSGLMLQVASQDIEMMFVSLDLALSSTWVGLIFAIGLKVLVALTSTRIINDVEIMLDDYDRNFNDIVAQRNISESSVARDEE